MAPPKRAAKTRAREKLRLLFKTRKRNPTPKRRASKKRKNTNTLSRTSSKKYQSPAKTTRPLYKSPVRHAVIDLTRRGVEDIEGRNSKTYNMIWDSIDRGNLRRLKSVLGDSPTREHVYEALNMATRRFRPDLFGYVAQFCDLSVLDVVSPDNIDYAYSHGMDVPTARRFIVEFGLVPRGIPYFIYKSNIEMVYMMVETGHFDLAQKKLLHDAAYMGRVHMVRLLLEEPRTDIFALERPTLGYGQPEIVQDMVLRCIEEDSHTEPCLANMAIIERDLCEAGRRVTLVGLRDYFHLKYPFDLIGEILDFLYS
eukprot:169320_1